MTQRDESHWLSSAHAALVAPSVQFPDVSVGLDNEHTLSVHRILPGSVLVASVGAVMLKRWGDYKEVRALLSR